MNLFNIPLRSISVEDWIRDHPNAIRWWSHDPADAKLILWYIDQDSGQMLLYKCYTVQEQVVH